VRGVSPHHVGRMHQVLLGVVGLADEEHFAVAGHDPAVELPVDGLVDLELDHSCWFSSSWVPSGAHQRRVIRGRRAVCSQPDLITVIILRSKLRPQQIRRPIRRYAPTDHRAIRRPERKLIPGLASARSVLPTAPTRGLPRSAAPPRAPTRRLAAASPTAPAASEVMGAPLTHLWAGSPAAS
jgi:hypothetical protein